MNVVLVSGSPSAHSRSQRLLAELGWRLVERGLEVGSLLLRELPPAALLRSDEGDEPLVQAALAQVAQARAVVFATPIYKAAYSGLLKSFIDLLPQHGLAGKFALGLASAGSPGHLFALDYALRPVLASLGSRFVLPSVVATERELQLRADGALVLDADVARRLDACADELLLALLSLPSRRDARPALAQVA